jgi:hypothetical protein
MQFMRQDVSTHIFAEAHHAAGSAYTPAKQQIGRAIFVTRALEQLLALHKQLYA